MSVRHGSATRASVGPPVGLLSAFRGTAPEAADRMCWPHEGGFAAFPAEDTFPVVSVG